MNRPVTNISTKRIAYRHTIMRALNQSTRIAGNPEDILFFCTGLGLGINVRAAGRKIIESSMQNTIPMLVANPNSLI